MWEGVLSRYEKNSEKLLDALLEIQRLKEDKKLAPSDLEEVARYFGVPYSRVSGVATFYHLISTDESGRVVVRICTSPTCFLKGGRSIFSMLKDLFSEQDVIIKETGCLGRCACAPVAMVGDEVFGEVTVDDLRKIISAKLKQS